MFKIVHGRTYQGDIFSNSVPGRAPVPHCQTVHCTGYRGYFGKHSDLLSAPGRRQGRAAFPGFLPGLLTKINGADSASLKAFHNKCLSAVPVIYSKRFLVCLIQRIYPALKVSCQSHFPTETDKLQELVLFQSNFFLRKTEKLFYRALIKLYSALIFPHFSARSLSCRCIPDLCLSTCFFDNTPSLTGSYPQQPASLHRMLPGQLPPTDSQALPGWRCKGFDLMLFDDLEAQESTVPNHIIDSA